MKRLLPSRHLRRPESGEGFFSFILILATFLVIAFVIRQAKDATRPEAITAARAEVRVKNLVGVEQSAQETLGSYAWQDEDKGFVRIPIEQAMSLTVKEWQDAGEGRAELISRMEKATALPPPAPEEPSAFE